MSRFCNLLVTLCLLLTLPAFSGDAKTAAPTNPQFEQLKNLVGDWTSPFPGDPTKSVHHSYKLISNGSALMLTTEVPGEGPMVTIFHPDGQQLVATHYCGAGNQPRYEASQSSGPKSISFKMKDATNLASPNAGHMSAATIQFIDADHHSQQWTWTENGSDKTETFQLQRSK